MSGDGLWKDTLDCGCAKYVGHSCRPLWMTEEEWFGTAVDGCDEPDSLLRLGQIGGDRMVREHHPIPSPPIHLEGGEA